ncbi:hypothetical protein LPB72_22435 [Hydrogenophaga crassostreae]|uniref:DUF4158 domain-containing protein n=1 Tax=Hydrogenophaga crassostreae TaxID=1763535 RepID=A0A162VNM6_9BURK|nr:hypothetical protein [Hydrogenophaga crassostreae]AOW11507.1 hypothetical protein LPB072_00160 [Hydrogenophaga crassostreae]OAD39346.1 hypothetical protein LPB72_22435 [Hydrogenophaga crassostreae]
MSVAAFQSLMAQLVVDPSLCERLRVDGIAADADLDTLERQRLLAIAASPGLSINHTLHRGFRLGKLKALLPLTCTLMKGVRLQTAIERFWAAHPPRTFYFLPEAVEFCGFLLTQPSRSRYLREVVAFERSNLELQRARLDTPPQQTVQFDHDPGRLLGQLAAGHAPKGVPVRSCTAVGNVDDSGRVRWALQA